MLVGIFVEIGDGNEKGLMLIEFEGDIVDVEVGIVDGPYVGNSVRV